MALFGRFEKKMGRYQPLQKKALADKIGYVFFAISKEQVLEKDVSMFNPHIESVCIPQIRSGHLHSLVVLSVSGYDEDPRELWDILEVILWFKKLHEAHPYLPHFLSPGSVQLYLLMLEAMLAYDEDFVRWILTSLGGEIRRDAVASAERMLPPEVLRSLEKKRTEELGRAKDLLGPDLYAQLTDSVTTFADATTVGGRLLVPLLVHIFAAGKVYFEHTLGSLLPQCHATIDKTTQRINQAFRNLIAGKWTDV